MACGFVFVHVPSLSLSLSLSLTDVCLCFGFRCSPGIWPDTRRSIRLLHADWQVLWHRFPTGNHLEGTISVAALSLWRHHRVHRVQCRVRVSGQESRGAQHGPQLHHREGWLRGIHQLDGCARRDPGAGDTRQDSPRLHLAHPGEGQLEGKSLMESVHMCVCVCAPVFVSVCLNNCLLYLSTDIFEIPRLSSEQTERLWDELPGHLPGADGDATEVSKPLGRCGREGRCIWCWVSTNQFPLAVWSAEKPM